MRRAARADKTAPELDRAARALGVSVEVWNPTGQGGVPDRVWGVSGVNVLVEYKNPLGLKGGDSRSRLSEVQILWHGNWRGEKPYVVRTIEDVIALVSGVRKRQK